MRTPISKSEANPQGGYVALISAIIISAILVGLTAAVSQAGFFTRSNQLDGEYKRISLGLAESCQNVSLLRIAKNYNYQPSAGDKTVEVGPNAQGEMQTCDIQDIQYGPEVNNRKTATIITQGEFRGTYSTMQVSVTVQNPVVPIVHKASLTIVTHVVNDNGGTAQAGNFTITVKNNSAVISTFLGTETDTYAYFLAGSFEVSGTDDTDHYIKTEDNCSGPVTQAQADNETYLGVCTISYDDKATTATLTLTANVTNSWGGTLKPSDVALRLDGNAVSSGAPQSGIVAPSTHTLSLASTPGGYTVSAWGGDPGCGSTISLQPRDSKTCAVNIVQDAPPGPACADTIMMLDRTGSMSGSDLANERNAAIALLDKYKNITPKSACPKVGVGVFKTPGGADAGISTGGHLTNANDYSSLYTAINNDLSNSSGIGTNLAAAINVAKAEFEANGSKNSDNTPYPRVLILLSDGMPCSNILDCLLGNNSGMREAALDAADAAKNAGIQIFTIHFGDDPAGYAGRELLANMASGKSPVINPENGVAHNDGSANDQYGTANTGFLNPTAQSQNANGDSWTNASNAFADGGAAATDNAGHRHRFSNFGISGLSGTINGIEVKADAWASGAVANILSENFGTNNSATVTGWTEQEPAELIATTSGEDVFRNGNSTNKFAKLGQAANGTDGWICRSVNASGRSNLTLSYFWNGDSDAESSDFGLAEYFTGGTCANPTGLATLVSHALNDSTWNTQAAISLPASLNNSTFFLRFRNNANATNEYFRVDDIAVAGSAAINAACQVGVDLSWNAGTNWTSPEQIKTLTGSETAYTFGSATDIWGRGWASGDFSNNNFRVRVHNIDPDPGGNTQCTNGATVNLDWLQVKVHYASTTVDVNAENADNDYFYIAPTPGAMAGIFTTIGDKVCPEEAVNPPPTATTASLVIINHVIRDNGGTAQSGDFTVHISGSAGLNPSKNDFVGEDAPGVTVTVQAGNYTIDETGSLGSYSKIRGSSCTGTIAVGQTITCTIINDDLPPPPQGSGGTPPPGPANIDVDDWQEIP